MKKTILFVINSMGCGGAEKSLLSLLSLIDYQKYDITLLMFRRGGMFEPLLPSAVRIHDALDYMSFCAQPAGKQLLWNSDHSALQCSHCHDRNDWSEGLLLRRHRRLRVSARRDRRRTGRRNSGEHCKYAAAVHV